MTSPRAPVIHIGMPKTATKTLQWRLFAIHSGIYYLGRFDGPLFRGRYRQFGACRNENVFQLMNQIAYRHIRNPDFAHCRQILAEELRTANSEGLLPVWSWESYCTDTWENRRIRAQNLRRLLGHARILVGIRHPVSLLEAAFFQQLKRDNIGARYHRGIGPHYCDINEWIVRDAGNEVTAHLEYGDTIRLYVDLFGLENVCVLPFELLAVDANEFYRRVCAFMGIDLVEAASLLNQRVDNSRWTTAQIEDMERILSSFPRRLRFRYASKAIRKRMLGLSRSGEPIADAPKATAQVSSLNRDRILQRTNPGNLWLDTAFNLDLGSLGYFAR